MFACDVFFLVSGPRGEGGWGERSGGGQIGPDAMKASPEERSPDKSG